MNAFLLCNRRGVWKRVSRTKGNENHYLSHVKCLSCSVTTFQRRLVEMITAEFFFSTSFLYKR